MNQNLVTSQSKEPLRTICAYMLATLGIAAILDLLTYQSLSLTDRAPSMSVQMFRTLDAYTSPLALFTTILAAVAWMFRKTRALRILFDLTLLLSMLALLDNLVGLIICLFDKQENPGFLLLSAALVYLQNIAVFVVFYWHYDYPYQDRIARGQDIHPGIIFPHNGLSMESLVGWRPKYVDYLFLSFNTSSTFGPTLPIPLRASIQIGMMIQVTIAMAVLVMLAARAIGLIS